LATGILLPAGYTQTTPHSSITAKHAMVVAQEPLAAEAGLDVLKHGGNAIDAAIAVGFALAVTYPVAGNIGGGGFMLIRLADGRTAFFDFREEAPLAATRNMYLGPNGKPTRDSIEGWRSAGVPGTVAGFEAAHKKFGSLPWKALVLPAIKLAANGFPLSVSAVTLLQHSRSLQSDPESKAMVARAATAGTPFTQPELAKTLERVAADGARGFYEGPTAQTLSTEMKKHGGLITEEDLRRYKVAERTPLTGTYKAHGEQFDIITAPPPSAGGVGLLQMLAMLEGTGYNSDGVNSPKAIHFQAEVMRRFYADRSEYLGDPDFYNVPVKSLLDEKYIAWRRNTILPDRATPSDAVQPGLPRSVDAMLRPRPAWHESQQTTHYNVVDAQGNAVAVTYTLNNAYGNGITVPGLGFLLNDEMDDFAAAPGVPNMFGLVGSEANSIEPGKRPLSSMSPAIATHKGKLFLVIGAPGGSRITTGVFQVMTDIFDFHLEPQAAIDLPRLHQQWTPDFLYLEKGFPDTTQQALTKMGYVIQPIEGVARVQAIVVGDGMLTGGSDTRGESGKVTGY
jgi:gamma-glutamyltranspeptidase/glutathione hydrolase